MKPTFQTFSMILNSRPDLPAVKPVIDVFWNKWYQQTQKIILYYLKQEKLKDIHISEKKSNTPKSRVSQPNIIFTKDSFFFDATMSFPFLTVYVSKPAFLC